MKRWILTGAAVLAISAAAFGERVKDVATIKGVRPNALQGFGVLVGLDGTGDNSPAAVRALTSFLRLEDMRLTPADLSSMSIAAVIVTAQLGPFDRVGSALDVTVSAMGDATSVRGGQLLMTELRGADRQVYAVAAGPVAVGGFSATGSAATVSKGHNTVGRIPGGARVEKEELAKIVDKGEITLLLRHADFTTANRIVKAINELYPKSSWAEDAKAIRIKLPSDLGKGELTGFIGKIGIVEVEVDSPAMVIINERTGTIVAGMNVGISKVAITQGSLSISVEERQKVSQPNELSLTGETQVTDATTIRTIEEGTRMHVMPKQVSVGELAQALNAMGLTPSDLISVFQGLHDAKALQAELIIK